MTDGPEAVKDGSSGARRGRWRRVPAHRWMLTLAGVLVVGLVLGLDAAGALSDLDLASIDARFSLRGSLGPPRDVVVVGIDNTTFDYLDHAHPGLAHFPFARRLDAAVVRNLVGDGASVIAYDQQFTEPTDDADDNALIDAVRGAGNVVLATTEVGPHATTKVFGGGQGLAYSHGIAADAQFPIDSDGTVRRFSGQVLGLISFPMAAANRRRGQAIPFPGGRNATALFDFRGPAGTIPQIPFWRVLTDRFPRGTFRDKVVVIGATEPIFHDVFHTPTDVQMAGAEVQATGIDTALRGFPLKDAPGWVNGFLIAVLGLTAPMLALRRFWIGAAAMAVELAGLALATQLAFDHGLVVGFVYPALAGLLGLIAASAICGVQAAFERRLTREAFARFVPESVVGEALAQAEGSRLGGVHRQATVMFCDLRGFTGFAETREPAQTIEVLNRYLSTISDAILQQEGTLVSYMGDGIMAVFGAPIAQPDHADRAVAAAREALRRMAEFNQWLKTAGIGEGFKLGVGICTGLVMSGNVGSERRLEYAAIGDTTNIASRLEALTKGTPHQVFIAEETCAALASRPPDLIAVGELELAGRIKPVTVWTLAGADHLDPAAPPSPAPAARRRPGSES